MRLLLTVAISATLLVGIAASSATAGRLSIDRIFFFATFARVNFSGGFGTVECALTLEGRRHFSSISKVADILYGYMERWLPTGVCRSGEMTPLNETFPWHVTYRSFAGTLPNITAMSTNVIGMSFRIREPTFGVTCLARSTAASPAIMTFNREASGVLTSMALSGSLPCEGALRVTGGLSGTSSTLGTPAFTIRVTLI